MTEKKLNGFTLRLEGSADRLFPSFREAVDALLKSKGPAQLFAPDGSRILSRGFTDPD